MYIYTYMLYIVFPYRLLQHFKYTSSLCYTVGPCWLSVLYMRDKLC